MLSDIVPVYTWNVGLKMTDFGRLGGLSANQGPAFDLTNLRLPSSRSFVAFVHYASVTFRFSKLIALQLLFD